MACVSWAADCGGVSDIAIDGNNNIYVAGWSNQTWQDAVGQSPLHAHNGGGNINAVVLKLDSAGAYQWHTVYGYATKNGAQAPDSANVRIAISNDGGVYAAGSSNALGWVGDKGRLPVRAHTGSGYNGFVLSLGNDGSYRWHTFVPGVDALSDIAVDGAGEAYIAGVAEAVAGPSRLRARTFTRRRVFLSLQPL